MNEQLPSDLPASVRELADVAGLPAALKLVEKYGGSWFYVPARVDEAHELAALVGLDAALKLSQRYERTMVKVPRCVDAVRAERDRQIRRDHQPPPLGEGLSASKLARKYKLTMRQIWYVLGADDGAPTTDPRQKSLF